MDAIKLKSGGRFNISKWVKDNRAPLVLLVTLLACSIIIFAVYKIYGDQIVNWMPEWEDRPQYSSRDYLDYLFSEVMKNLLITSFFFAFILIITSLTKNKKFPQVAPIEWFYLLSGLFLSQWFIWTMDDAYIYFRYIDNLLLLKIGLVYNKGEYVEGGSSPLWMILLALLRTTGRGWMLINRLITEALAKVPAK